MLRNSFQMAARSAGGLPRVACHAARAASASSTERVAVARSAPGPTAIGVASTLGVRDSITRCAQGSMKRRASDARRISSPTRTRPASAADGRASHTAAPALVTTSAPSANLSRSVARVTGSVTTTSRTSSSSVPKPTPSLLPRSM